MSKFRKMLALLLAMLMVVCTLGVVTGASDGGDDELISSNGLVLSKKYNDGKLTLEAYVTGKTVTESKIEPVDVVLVLDVSGSMDEGIDAYEPVYELNKNDTYYYLDNNGKYKRAYYCERNWGIAGKCEAGWYDGYHGWFFIFPIHSGSKITPKTSVDSEGVQLYRNTSKMEALQHAATQFVELVAEKSPNSNIAIVKFAGESTDKIGNEVYEDGSNVYNYSQIVNELTKVDSSGASELKNSINKLVAGGATQADFGMQHAQKILENSTTGNKQVVIMFTDGEPNNHNGFVDSVANTAISASAAMKAKDVTVYTIGCFDNPNAAEIKDATAWNAFGNQDVNKYMNIVSSNCGSTATNMSASFSTYKYGGYYKTATSSTELSEIFKELSEAIGGAEITLNSETVLKDVISDYFDLPTVGGTIDKSGITAHTETCTAIDADGKPTAWTSDNNSYPVVVSADGKTLTVTGFDYSENWVGSHEGVAGGKKMVVTIPIIDNGTGMDPTTPTNTEESGIYNDETLVGQFEIPRVDFSSYTIKHIQNGTEKTALTETIRINGKDSLTDKVSEGYLYGGAFEDEGGYTTPFAFADGESGLSFTPTHGETYCIWEVSNSYLKPKSITLREHIASGAVDANGFYLVASVDRLEYDEVGFVADKADDKESTNYTPAALQSIETGWDSGEGNKDGTIEIDNVYNEIKIMLKNGGSDTYKIGETAWDDLEYGYLFCCDVPKDENWDVAGNVIRFTPYWITLDGVKVYSNLTRSCEYWGPRTDIPEGNYYVNKLADVENDLKPEACYSYDQFVSLLSLSAVANIEESSSIDNDNEALAPEYLCVKYFEQGWFKVYGVTLLSAIDNGNYRETGFIINGTKYSSDRLIGSYGVCTAKILFGSNISDDSKLMTYNLSLVGMNNGDTFDVTPYCITANGKELTGTTRILTYNSRGIKG